MKTFENSHNVRLRAFNILPGKQQTLLAIDYALIALPSWQKHFPEDERVEDALNLALKSVLQEGSVTKEELIAAGVAASYLANSNYYSAASDATAAAFVTVNAINAANASSTMALNYAVADASLHASGGYDWQPILDLYNQANQPIENQYRTPDTLGLAREILQNNFNLMPILADALLDLGCPEEQAELVRHGKGYSNWALYYLGNYDRIS